MAVKRREQAERTRNRILDVAYTLFCANGFEATTMQDIADDAEVAIQTVYFIFGTKAKLLAEVESRVVLGGAATQWREMPWAKRLGSETDPGKVIDLFVDADTEIKARVSPFLAAVGSALSDASATRGTSGRDGFFRGIVERLHSMGALRKGLTVERAVDIIRVVNTPDAYTDLTLRRGWTQADWKRWLKGLLRTELLGQPRRGS